MTTTATERTIPPDAVISVVGLVLLAGISATLYLLGCLWPIRVPGSAVIDSHAYFPGLGIVQLADECRYLCLVALAAALGSYIHAATSFATYAGNRTLAASWIWWYILRAPLGAALGLVVYFAVRGGLLAASATGSDINPFGICALGALTGMFSKQATDKLRETFDTLFRTAPGQGDDARTGKLSKPREKADSLAGVLR